MLCFQKLELLTTIELCELNLFNNIFRNQTQTEATAQIKEPPDGQEKLKSHAENLEQDVEAGVFDNEVEDEDGIAPAPSPAPLVDGEDVPASPNNEEEAIRRREVLRNRAKSGQTSFKEWFIAIFTLTDEEIKYRCGNDALQYLR